MWNIPTTPSASFQDGLLPSLCKISKLLLGKEQHFLALPTKISVKLGSWTMYSRKWKSLNDLYSLFDTDQTSFFLSTFEETDVIVSLEKSLQPVAAWNTIQFFPGIVFDWLILTTWPWFHFKRMSETSLVEIYVKNLIHFNHICSETFYIVV